MAHKETSREPDFAQNYVRYLTARVARAYRRHVSTTTPTTGLGLKLARTAERVKQWQVADAMGVSPSRVASIEREAVVSPKLVDRYMKALDTCRTGTSEGIA